MERQASDAWQVHGLDLGAHLGFLYETEDQRRVVLRLFFRQGLEKNEKVIYIADATSAETVLERLDRDIPGLGPHLARGQLTILPTRDAYLRSGIFDPEEMIALLKAYTEGALAEGYAGLRVTGEMTWALKDSPGADRLIEYEARLNDFILGSRCLALCQYPMQRFPSPLLLDVLRTHPQTMIGTEVYDGHHYVPPSVLLGTDRAASDLRRWMVEMVDQKRRDAALRESEVYFREITENASDMILILNKAGDITYASPSVKRFLGYCPEEVIGKKTFTFIHPTDIQRAMRDFGEALQMNEVAVPNSFRVLHKDGSERVLEGLGRNLLDHPAVAGFIMNVQDITARVSAQQAARKAEEALRKAAGNWQSTFDAMIDGLALLSPDGTVRQCNRAFSAFLGQETSAPVGQKCCRLVHRTENPVPGCPRVRSRETGRRETMELPAGEKTFFVVTDPIKSPDGEITAFIHILHDITERKRAEAERLALENRLLNAKKAESLGRMAGAIAHHFNNQLQAVMGNLELVMDEEQNAGTLSNLSEAMNAARKAARVSGQMLTYLGQTSAERKQLDLSEACHVSLPMLGAAMPKNTVMETDLPTPGPGIRANPNQMQQVLTHLVANAYESMAEAGGVIHLSVKTAHAEDIPATHRFPADWQPRGNAYACLEVRDSGLGIAESDMERLFDPFFSTKFTGRGMGLPVALGIVKAHGGAITVESPVGRRKTDDGRRTTDDGVRSRATAEPGTGNPEPFGSVFRVYLPLAAREVGRPVEKSARAPKLKGGGTVLVIEDELPLRQLAERMIMLLGFEALTAKDGVEGVEVFRENQDRIRLVLSDLTMPRMDGWETLAALRKVKPGIPVILASGYDEASVMSGAHAERPQSFLGKPYSLEDLTQAIGKVQEAVESEE